MKTGRDTNWRVCGPRGKPAQLGVRICAVSVITRWLEIRRPAFTTRRSNGGVSTFLSIVGKTRFSHYREDEENFHVPILVARDALGRHPPSGASPHPLLSLTHKALSLVLCLIFAFFPLHRQPPRAESSLILLLIVVADVSRTPGTVPPTWWLLIVSQ